MYIYLLSTKKHQLKVYLYLGCTLVKTFIAFYAELLILYLLSFGLNLILYKVVFIKMLTDFMPAMRFTLGFDNFLSAFLINLGLLTAVFVPIIIHYNDKYMFVTKDKTTEESDHD
jgi:hypothetical protein